MACEPTASALVAQLAVPATVTPFAPQPAMVVPPSSQFTLPVRTPKAAAVTVTLTVKVTLAPVLEGLSDEAIAVPVAPGLTGWVTTTDVLAAKLASPL